MCRQVPNCEWKSYSGSLPQNNSVQDYSEGVHFTKRICGFKHPNQEPCGRMSG